MALLQIFQKDSSLLLVLFVSLFSLISEAAFLERNSFRFPFLNHTHEGKKQVPGWIADGSAVVFENFVRLTSMDESGQKGALWSSDSLHLSEEFSLIFAFQMIGQKLPNSGEGIALWITQSDSHSLGDFYGSALEFAGLAVVMKHNSISVFIHSTAATADPRLPVATCSVALRHVDHGGFKSFNVSTMRLIWKRGDIVVEVDGQSQHLWQACAHVSNSFPSGWASTASVHITASGSADIQSVTSLEIFDNANEATFWPQSVLTQQEKLVSSNSSFEKRARVFLQQWEYHFIDLTAALSQTLSLLKKDEENLEERILDLENRLQEKLHETLESRIKVLESKQHEAVWSRVKKIKLRLDDLEQRHDFALSERLANVEKRFSPDIVYNLQERVGALELRADRNLNFRLGALESNVHNVLKMKLKGVESHWKMPFSTMLILCTLLLALSYKSIRNLGFFLANRIGRPV